MDIVREENTDGLKSEASYFFPKPPSLPLGFWRSLQLPKKPSTIRKPTRYIHSHLLFFCLVGVKVKEKREKAKCWKEKREFFFFPLFLCGCKPMFFYFFCDYLFIYLFGNCNFYRSHFIVFCSVSEKTPGKSEVSISAEYIKL